MFPNPYAVSLRLIKAPGLKKSLGSIKDFWIANLGKGQYDYGETENRGPETLGSIIKAPWLKAP